MGEETETQVFSSFLPVDGASLYYEIRGTGPLLVIVPAALGTAHAHESNASKLAAAGFKVLTYDRRGYGRSELTGPFGHPADPKRMIPQAAADLALLITRFSTKKQPSFVFGSCFGGAVVLQLLQDQPELVRKVLVHEPSIALLTPPSEQKSILDTFDSMPQLYEKDGPRTASKRLMPLVTSESERMALKRSSAYDRILDATTRYMIPFYQYEYKFARVYEVDFTLLSLHRDKLVLARGCESILPMQKHPVKKLSETLGLSLVTFPGAHFPFATDQDASVDLLLQHLHRPRLEQQSISRQSYARL